MSSSRCCKATCAASCWGPDSAPLPQAHTRLLVLRQRLPLLGTAALGSSGLGQRLTPVAVRIPRLYQEVLRCAGGAEVSSPVDKTSPLSGLRKAEGLSLQPQWAV